jgi:hypothetical protein
MIAQIDEQHTAMIALAVNPARQADGLSNMAGAQGAAGVGTVKVHRNSFQSPRNGAGAQAEWRG